MANPTLVASRMALAASCRPEAWKIEHDEVQICWSVEDRLRGYTPFFDEYIGLVKSYIDEIRWEPYWTEDDEKQFLGILADILKSNSSGLESLGSIESEGHVIEGAQEFRDRLETLKQLSAELNRIVNAEGRMGYHGVEVGEQAAAEFHEMNKRRGVA